MSPETFEYCDEARALDDSCELDKSWDPSNKRSSAHSRCEMMSLMDMLDVPTSVEPVAIVDDELVKRNSSICFSPTKSGRQITGNDLTNLLSMFSTEEADFEAAGNNNDDDLCNWKKDGSCADTVSTRGSLSCASNCDPSHRQSTSIRNLEDLFALFEDEDDDTANHHQEQAATAVMEKALGNNLWFEEDEELSTLSITLEETTLQETPWR